MNLIQRGTTASRANRGKSVKGSIAQSNDSNSYERNGGIGQLDSARFHLPFTLKTREGRISLGEG